MTNKATKAVPVAAKTITEWDETREDRPTRSEVLSAAGFVPLPQCEGCNCMLGEFPHEDCWKHRNTYMHILTEPPFVYGTGSWCRPAPCSARSRDGSSR